MSIVQPFHTAEINGTMLRFFRAPTDRPELLWHAADDLFAVCGFPPKLRERFRRSLQGTCGPDVKTIATATGPVLIAPHVAAQGLLEAAAEIPGALPTDTQSRYIASAAEAMRALTGNLPPIASFEFAMQAARNSGIGDDGGAA